MKILMIWIAPDYSFPMSLSSLSAYMKQKRGDKTKLITLITQTNHLSSNDYELLKKTIEEFKPDICGFTVFEPTWNVTKLTCDYIKKISNIKNVIGGYFPILSPDLCIIHPSVDAVCMAEGENGFPEYCEYLEGKRKRETIPNFYIKGDRIEKCENNTLVIDENIYRGKREPLSMSMDELPYPDRECIDFQYYLNQGKPMRSCKIIASRGCPLECSYCSVGETRRKMYPNQPAQFMRFRSPENVIDEIRFLKSKYEFETIGFHDDNPISIKKWVMDFCDKYIASGLKYPFYMAGRPETARPEVAKRLKEAGCYLVLMGVESGNEEIRRKILNRPMSNEMIINSFKTINEAGIGAWSFTMVGVPGETLKTLWDTFKLNWKIKPDLVMCSYYTAFHGTPLGDKCFKEGLVDLDRYSKISSIAKDTSMKFSPFMRFAVRLFKWLVVFTACRRMYFWECIYARLIGKTKLITKEMSNMIPKRNKPQWILK